jgi:hypothetical protein
MPVPRKRGGFLFWFKGLISFDPQGHGDGRELATMFLFAMAVKAQSLVAFAPCEPLEQSIK